MGFLLLILIAILAANGSYGWALVIALFIIFFIK
ncbi:hypothetical protein PHIN3_169 [Sinorhizobium phage phiN3]|uniref:Transmembrane protein n=1 Tax=Sinorhizobium phage phiN3 TaxID=1647405 RepID=A0A0F6WCQ4_9CAUD|nr:hypothetical protein AVT40_gp364 [Sinorhizobium phage phiN3]AKF13432.1 hypothetical protein PHIN3_169 [Sinorhizobium phage phiN3]